MLVLFFGRAIWGVTMLVDSFTWLEVSSSVVALLLGICYVPCLGILSKERR